MSSRPSRTLLPGIGIASAVLAGMLLAFAVAAQLIGLELRAREQSPDRPLAAVALEDRLEPARSSATRLPTPPARTRTPDRRAVAAPAVLGTKTSTISRVSPVPPPPPPPGTPPPPPSAADAAPAPPPPPAAPSRPRAPLEPLGSAVNKTTDNLADTLRALTEGLGEGVRPLSPQLGTVLDNTGDALGDVVEGTGNVLGQALGGRR